jgi:hypothetical protein
MWWVSHVMREADMLNHLSLQVMHDIIRHRSPHDMTSDLKNEMDNPEIQSKTRQERRLIKEKYNA